MKRYKKDKLTMIYAAGLLVMAILGTVMTADAGVSIPNTFTSGSTISSSAMNANFTAVANQMPAVKNVGPTMWIQVPSTATALQSVSFTAPGTGYVLVMASGTFVVNHTSGYTVNYCAQVSTTSGETSGCSPSGNAAASRSNWSSTMPTTVTQGFGAPYSIVEVYPVTATTSYIFYLNGISTIQAGAPAGDSVYLFQPTLTVLFVPNTL